MPGMTSMCSPSFCNIRMNKFELNRILLFQFIELEHVELGQNQQNYELKMMRTPPKKYIEKILSDRSFFQHAIYDVSDLYVWTLSIQFCLDVLPISSINFADIDIEIKIILNNYLVKSFCFMFRRNRHGF